MKILKIFSLALNLSLSKKKMVAKLVKIFKGISLYKNPKLSDFGGGVHENKDEYGWDSDFCLRTRDLAGELGINMMRHLTIVDEGLTVFNKKFKVKGKEKSLQMVRIKLQWDYEPQGHYGEMFSERGEDRILDAVFDLQGKLSLLRMHLAPRKILRAEKDIENIKNQEKINKAQYRSACNHLAALDKEFDKKYINFIDNDNALYKAGYSFKRNIAKEDYISH